MPTVLGHITSKNEEIDQMKSGGQQSKFKAKFIDQKYKASKEGGDPRGLPFWHLNLGVF